MFYTARTDLNLYLFLSVGNGIITTLVYVPNLKELRDHTYSTQQIRYIFN